MALDRNSIPLECYKENQDAIRTAIYEKCARGEITLAQREQVLSVLNEYVEASDSILENYFEAFENYMEDRISDEEFDTIVEAYMEEKPELFYALFGEDILDRANTLKECVQMVYDEGGIERKEGKALFKRIDEMADLEFAEREMLIESPDMLTESADEDRVDVVGLEEGFSTVVEHVLRMEEDGEISLESCHRELIRMVNEYCDTIQNDLIISDENHVYEDAVDDAFNDAFKDFDARFAASIDAFNAQVAEGERFDKAVNTALIVTATAMIATLAAIIARPFVNKAKAKKVISGYEKLMKPKIKYSDLNFKSMNLYDLSEKFLPQLKSLLKRDVAIKGKGFVIYYNNKPFGAIAQCHDATYGAVGDGLAYSTSARQIFYSQIMKNADINPHKDYYRTAIMMRKYGMVDPEARNFLKTVMKDLKNQIKEAEKKAKQMKREKEKASKAASKVTKEFVENSGNINLFESVEKEIYRRFNRGEYSLDQREELLSKARERYLTGE